MVRRRGSRVHLQMKEFGLVARVRTREIAVVSGKSAVIAKTDGQASQITASAHAWSPIVSQNWHVIGVASVSSRRRQLKRINWFR